MSKNYIQSCFLSVNHNVLPSKYENLHFDDFHFKHLNEFWFCMYVSQQLRMKHLENMCHTDDLTQLRNKRYFNFYLESCWKELADCKAPLSVIFLDIDNLKVYNLMWGQAMGDKCVYQIASVIPECINQHGALVARYQDDTFAIVLPNTVVNNALEIAEVIREEVKKLDIKHAVGQLGGLRFPVVTVSLGVACAIPTLENSPNILVDAAFNALHRAKKFEGNCTCVSTC